MNKLHRKPTVQRKAPSLSLASIATELKGIPDPVFVEQLERELISSLSEPPLDVVILYESAGGRKGPESKLTRT
jgi:hypothetical protein